MAITPAQKSQVRKFVIANYAPKLRRGALKKFTIKAEKDGLGFLSAATARGKAKAPAPKAKPAPGPYDRYKPLGPGPIGTLSAMDKMRDWHLADAGKVQSWLSSMISPVQQGGAQMGQYYADLASQAANIGALPNQMPIGYAPGTQAAMAPGAAGADVQAAGIAGQGAAAAGTQAASYQGWMADRANRDLSAGIAAHFAGQLGNLGGQYNQAKLEYMQTLDQNLFELESAKAEQEAEMAIEEMKLANDRYTARLGLVGQLTGAQSRLQIADMNNQADIQQGRETNATRERVAMTNAASRESIAAANNRLKALKIQADRAKGTAKQRETQTKLLRSVQKEFDALWTGEAPDPLVPGSGHGWRYTARSRDKATREKAAYQVLSWLAATGLVPAHVHRLFRSKGFSDAEFQRAVRRVEGGGGY